MFITWLTVAGVICAALLLATALLHLLPKIGLAPLTDWFTRAPGLDLWIFYFTIIPLVAAPIAMVQLTEPGQYATWLLILLGLAAAIIAQMIAVLVWTRLHELANPAAIKGPRLVSQINRNVAPWRNHLAVWWTTLAAPVFALVRLAELFVYPPLAWIVHLPKYKTADWVNVSRHKFEGLVGHDLIWCLYCDWMTGVWSLGTEMLRNVESFWCPIRFYSGKKCENCAIDFPDLDAGWAPSDGTMQDVVDAHAKHYPGPDGDNQWFGHPARLTQDGKPIDESE